MCVLECVQDDVWYPPKKDDPLTTDPYGIELFKSPPPDPGADPVAEVNFGS